MADIKQQVAWIVGGDPTGLQEFLAQDGVLDAMAQAHDAEECAQKGEPDPWSTSMQRDYVDQASQAALEEWKSERRAAMLCALKAVGLA